MGRLPLRHVWRPPTIRDRMSSLINKHGIDLEKHQVLCPLKQHCKEYVPFATIERHKQKRHSKSYRRRKPKQPEDTCKAHRLKGVDGLCHALGCDGCMTWLLHHGRLTHNHSCYHITDLSPTDTAGGTQLWGWGDVTETIFSFVGTNQELTAYREVSRFFNSGIINNTTWQATFWGCVRQRRQSWVTAVEDVNRLWMPTDDPWMVVFHKTFWDVAMIKMGKTSSPRLLCGAGAFNSIALPDVESSDESDSSSLSDSD
eukprot:TRINITY_DN67744_c6_g1_i1.p1 TRINITY_DN67744_c6_g1~~TRINITY_DN67744_c6_g1_i1.p1  ORF type:complete len:257 (-),score=0.75 TRINITY_DN67744_c6_g1_i1:156-926(-)